MCDAFSNDVTFASPSHVSLLSPSLFRHLNSVNDLLPALPRFPIFTVLSTTNNNNNNNNTIAKKTAARRPTTAMRWSFNRSRIASAELRQVLQRHRESMDAQSSLWLSEAQAKYHYRVQCRGGISVSRGMFPQPSVYSIAEYSPSERRSLLQLVALPTGKEHKWLLLTDSRASREQFAWRAATSEQYAEALLTSPATEVSFDGALLVAASVAVPSCPQQNVLLLNAQETSNPFLIDDSLHHKHFITGEPFPHSVASALSTLWSQFSYISMRWLPNDDVMRDINVSGAAVKANQEPHAVFDPEPVQFIHLGQLEATEQEQGSILHSAPRWALELSLRRAVIFSNGKWTTWRRMELDEDLKLTGAASAAAAMAKRSQCLPQHQVWLHVNSGTRYRGAPINRYILRRRLFYNSSQIEA